MIRRVWTVVLCGLILGAGIWLANRPVAETTAAQNKGPQPSEREYPHFVVFPYLQYATSNSVTIMWETSFPGSSVVRYGVGTASMSKEGPKDVTLHEVTLADLKPGTNYVYEVTTENNGKKVSSGLLTFQTVVGPEDVYSFVLIGDTQKNPTITGKVATLAWQRRPNFVIHLGDVVDRGPDKREWVHELFGPCKDLLSRVPIYPCIGNHEANHINYYRYFSLPAPEYYYHFRYGNADFYSLDTNKRVDPTSEQYRWLDAELAKSTAKWKIVYHHHPAYTSDSDDYGNTFRGAASKQGDMNARHLVTLYEKHNVDMVFNGHIHVYERTWPIRNGKVDREKGVLYITSGGGGGRLEDAAPIPTWFKAMFRSDYHYCYATVHGGRMSFKAFDHQGVLFDSFELDKK